MFEPITLKEKIIFTSVRIATKTEDGIKTGTSFAYTYEKENLFVPFLVTNKHIVQGAIEGTLLFNKGEKNNVLLGETVKAVIPNFEKVWTYHPNEKIDVAVMPLGALIYHYLQKGIRIFFAPLEKN